MQLVKHVDENHSSAAVASSLCCFKSMKRVAFEALALCATVCSVLLLTASLGAGKWISTCVPLATLVMKASAIETAYGSQSVRLDDKPDLRRLIPKRQAFATDMDLEEVTLLNELALTEVCASQGFFSYCIYGNKLFKIGGYSLCISTNTPDRAWSNEEKFVLTCISVSLCITLSVIFLLVVRWTDCLQHCTRIVNLSDYVIPLLTFVAGSVLTLGLFFVIVQSIVYANDPSLFYNDMVQRLFTVYSQIALVNWEMTDAITDVHVWARRVSSSMRSIGLDRDFYVTLCAAVLLFVACSCLIFRPKRDSSDATASEAPLSAGRWFDAGKRC